MVSQLPVTIQAKAEPVVGAFALHTDSGMGGDHFSTLTMASSSACLRSPSYGMASEAAGGLGLIGFNTPGSVMRI